MASFIRNILGLWGGKVGEGISVCQALRERVQQGQTLTTDDEIHIQQLKKSVSRLTDEVQRFTQIHQGSTPPEMEDMLDELTTLIMKADDTIVGLEVQISHKTNLGASETRRSVNNCSGSAALVATHTTSRLPILDVPKFDGDILKWHEFWSKFTSIIEGRSDLTDVDKLTYLQLALEGSEAKSVIAGLTTTNETYQIAVDALMEEYGEKGILIDAHYMALFGIPKASQDVKENKRVLTEIDRHFRVLNALGETTGNNNALRAITVSKFSAEVQSDLRMMINPTEECVENIIRALKVIIKARDGHTQPNSSQDVGQTPSSNFTTEALYAQDATENSSNKRKFESQKRKFNQPSRGNKRTKWNNNPKQTSSGGDKKGTDRTDTSNKPRGSNSRPLRCIFCSSEHMHENCSQYKTIEERRSKLSDRCFLCLRKNHSVRDCTRSDISCIHCKKKGHHNRCLCPTKYGKANTVALFTQAEHDTILQTALAPVESKTGRTETAKLLFDCGSQRSYIHSSLAKKLGLAPLERTCLTVFTFGTTKPKNIPADLVNVRVQLDGQAVDMMAYVVPSTTGALPSHVDIKDELRREFPTLDWAADTAKDTPADIIVGNDYYYNFILSEARKIADNLHLVNTRLGWIPSGSFVNNNAAKGYQLSVLTYVERGCVCRNEDLFVRPDPAIRNDEIKLLWELDIIGITDSPKAIQDEDVIQFFKSTTKFVDNRYYVKWPWVEFPPNLPVNFGLSFGRLKSLFKRLNNDQKQQYNEVLADQRKRGVIEEITETQLPKTHPVHYLPHHCVLQENKSTKLRIVYDASAKPKGHCSLNELLYKGPLMLEDLTSLLLNFRCHAIGIVADIEKAFLQVGLQHDDRDVTRFLWVRDINSPPSENNLVQFRFCRVPFGIISSPFLLAATIRYHILSKNTEHARKLADCLYVDNLVTGVKNQQEAMMLYQIAKGSLDELSMNLRGWNSNEKGFLSSLPQDQRDQQETISVLGLKWDTIRDTLQLMFPSSKLTRPANTKRGVLRIIASVFDPCGFVAPLTLPTRMFLQNLWKKGIKWDSTLSSEETKAWNTCVEYLKMVPEFATQRRYVKNDIGTPSLELHCFADASKDAYVAVVYVRVGSSEQYEVSYVISKSRVTPLQRRETLTTPKLELLAVVIGTRLLNYVQKALELSEVDTYLWSDNQAVLGWLQTERLLPPWVSRRIGEVQKSKHIRIKYVPSHLNPADAATRPPQLYSIPDCWMHGPDFLRLPSEQWPGHNQQAAGDTSGSGEPPLEIEQAAEPVATYAMPLTETTTDETDWDLPELGSVIPIQTVKHLQRKYFPNEFSSIKTNLSQTLGLFTDQDGILRCKGRYQNAVLSFDQKYPILLPKESAVTRWIIRRIHTDNYHVGVAHTLSLLRHQYWVPHGRATVSTVLKRCPACVKYGGGPFPLPPMPDLPKERISYSAPFTYTGLDYLGPLVVTENGISIKRWVCLFTCLAVRAVHLEIVNNLSAEEFILCLRRFVATRGVPKLILSDNATQFKLVSTLLTAPIIQGNKIEWKFITELSPWQGGVYERLVGLVKHCLHRTIDKAMLNDSQLRTIMKEIEAVLNTRPLTAVGADHEQVLTPAHFLRTCGPPDFPHPSGKPPLPGSIIRDHLVAGWKRTRTLLGEFERMFINQYLLSLRDRHNPAHKQPRVISPRDPHVGDVVQVKGDTPNRGRWAVGTIASLSRGSDGRVRSARVALVGGTVLNRSVGHLYPLEMDLAQPQLGQAVDSPEAASSRQPLSPGARSPVTTSPTPHLRASPSPGQPSASYDRPPRRDAALEARRHIRRLASSLFSLALRPSR